MGTLPVIETTNPEAHPPGGGDARRAVEGLMSAVTGEVRLGLHDRMLYATDASLYQVEPLAVVIPSDVEDAARAAASCARAGLAILPRGGGTSLAGQCTNRAVVIDFSANCRGITAYDDGRGECTVEPGITIDDLNDELARRGRWFFAPDPATSRHCNIGGAIGNNAAGARSILYGRTSESLLGVEAWLAGGRRVRLEEGAAARDPAVHELTRRVASVVTPIAGLIRERFPRTIRRNAGYALDMVLSGIEKDPAGLTGVNLAHLLCGSEGTLAVTLGARLRLHERPRSKGLCVLGFDDLDAAIASVPGILTTGPSAVELLDDMVLGLAGSNAEYRRYVDLMPRGPSGGAPKAVLYVEYFAGSIEEVRGRFAALRGVVPGIPAAEHTEAGAMLSAWKLRKAGEPLLHGVAGSRKPITFIEDNAVPVARLGEFVRRLREIVTRHGTTAAYWAHASVGVLHVRPLIDIHDAQDRGVMRSIAVEAADLARELGGVMSGEHGDGRVRGPLLERFFGPEIVRAFRDVKAIFDPKNLLNPGNITDPGSVGTITERLRVEPEPDRPAAFPGVATYFRYDDQHGFDGAVEMCNGAGVCRKKQGGTMCPSYQATLDERHSTRGRGNALRLAITGQSVPGGSVWNDPETLATLNLCLSCKACKTECPSNVDISRLKAEYVAQGYRERGGPPLSARLFGHVRALNRLGSLTPGVATWMNRTRLAKWVLRAFAGIDPRRDVPAFSRPLTRDLPAYRPGFRGAVLFGDCFTVFNEPGVGRATRDVYAALGVGLALADAGCCGRSMISTGLLPDAIDAIDTTLGRLRPIIEDDGVDAVLVAEPSCLSAIKDDWLQLDLRTPMTLRRRLAEKCRLPEDDITRRPGFGPMAERIRALGESGPRVLLHGHCHQKALWGVETSAVALRAVLGDRLTVLDTGCCGMAGSFGYTADRYDLSMKIGGMTLFPAVRGEPGAVVCAPGTSCRHQVHDGTGRRATHPIELIADLMGRVQPPA
ncbi:MAG: FAD-binding protein [Phycisphaeraceae bacterium]|nr:MAG: FAD-binding protein [Phycisphaeraceae bacterium]